MGRKQTPTIVLAVLAIVASGCGSGDDETGANSPDATLPAESADAVEADDDAQPADSESDQEAPGQASAATENIRDGVGTLTIVLSDGRTETRDVDCSIYSDQFEVTFEYSDILDDDQSVNFYFREEGTQPSDVNFTFQDPQLGGLVASNPATASNTAMSGSTLTVDLNVLMVGSVDAAGNPEATDISVTGTCAAS